MADALKGAARAFLGQGLGMGWGDEAEAFLRSRLGDQPYEQALKQIRQEYAQYAKEYPFTSGAAEFAGGMAPAVGMMFVPGAQPAAAAQAQRTTLGTLGRLAALGGATGAVSGAGSAEEGGRAQGAVVGGTIGTALGLGTPVALRSAKGAGQWLRERLAPTESVIQRRASEKFARAMGEEKLTPQQIEAKMRSDRAMGVPSVVANVNPALADLAEAVAQRTGQGARRVEKTLTEQKTGSRERTYQQVTKGLHPGDYYADEERLVGELRKRADSMYEPAYSAGTVNDPVINEVLKDPHFAAAFEKAKSIANKEALAAKLRGEDPSRFQLQDIYTLGKDAEGNVIVQGVKAPDVRTLDYVKRGLDTIIDAGFRGQGIAPAEANALKQVRNQFVQRIDDLVPEYKAARGAYAGDIEVIDAMRAGMNDFGKMDHEQVIKLVSGMSAAEKEAFRTGVARDLYSTIMKPSGNFNSAQRIIGSPEMQAKLQPLFDSPAHFDLFKSALEREAQLFGQANKILGGSPTGKRTQMRELLEEGPGVGEAVATAVTGGFWPSLTGMAARAIRSSTMTEPVAEKLSRMLMSKDPNDVAAVVKLLEEHATAQAPKAVRSTALERGATMGGAAAIQPTPAEDVSAASGADIESDLKPAETPGIEGPDIEADLTRELEAEKQSR